MWTVKYLKEAKADMKKLDKAFAKQVLKEVLLRFAKIPCHSRKGMENR